MVEAIRANGWRQGSIFAPQSHPALQDHCRSELGDDDCCLVISQSCDLVCRDVEAEPFVELILARRLHSPLDGNFTHTKNARRLHFHLNVGAKELGFDARIRDRFTIPRPLLAQHKPDANRSVREVELKEIVTWILARYSRAAFPDQFNDRISAAVEKRVKPILKELAPLRAIYIGLNSWDELEAKDTYLVYLLGILSVEDFNLPSVRAAMESGLTKIAAILDTCEGITVDNSEVQSEAQVTLDLVRTLARWNFDYISLRQPDEHKLLNNQ
jgi:hypothetical protein